MLIIFISALMAGGVVDNVMIPWTRFVCYGLDWPGFRAGFGSFFKAFIQLMKNQSASAQVRACVYSSFGKERRDGQGQPEDTTIPLLRLLLPTRGGTVRYLSFDGEHGPRIQSQYSHIFLTSERARRGEAKTKVEGKGEKRSRGRTGLDWPWPRMRVDPWRGKKKTKNE